MFDMESSADFLEHYLGGAAPYDHIRLMLFSHGVDSVGLAPTAACSVVASPSQHYGQMKVYSVDLHTKIVEALKKGVSKSETARRFGVNHSTVHRYLKRLNHSGSLASKRRLGQPPKLDGRAMFCCLSKTSKLVPGLPTARGASSSLWSLQS